MILLFYSNNCILCKKIIEFIKFNNLKNHFKLLNVDIIKKLPNYIIPTLLDTIMEIQIEGDKVYDFIINQKYFFQPTNNIEYLIKYNNNTPTILEDKKAIISHNFQFASVNDNDIIINTPKVKPNIINNRILTLLRRTK